MGRAIVIGGSVGGLMTALALSRAGWDVDVLERDPLPDVDDVEAAFRCHPRPAVPQAGHSHNLFAGTVTALRDAGRLPIPPQGPSTEEILDAVARSLVR